jgi:glutamate synthase domain-containing protein 1
MTGTYIEIHIFMASKKRPTDNSADDALRQGIGELVEKSARPTEKLTAADARRMLEYLTERGQVTAQARRAVGKLAEGFPMVLYERYINAKLADLGAKTTTEDAKILDTETIAALQQIADSEGATESTPATRRKTDVPSQGMTRKAEEISRGRAVSITDWWKTLSESDIAAIIARYNVKS